MCETLLSDSRYGFRMLRKTPRTAAIVSPHDFANQVDRYQTVVDAPFLSRAEKAIL
jgi:hypothetical protein